jgi:hypothetical protein
MNASSADEVDVDLEKWPPKPLRPRFGERDAGEVGEMSMRPGTTPIWYVTPREAKSASVMSR